jgi:hypothetical protein
MSATNLLEYEFLPLRAKLLDIAATLDRLDRVAAPLDDDARMSKVHQAMEILMQPKADRTAQIQMVFSRAYQEDWPTKFGLTL